jgi:deoxynucleoside triphosphate triphosphohydrolase SAMHD1
MKAIIDTSQFQRLRGLFQLGTSEQTYMNANHRRFEHSIGVAHLAKRMVERIRKRQPQLNITEKDVLCVKLAGLLHDLGHGPFSHFFISVFPNRLGKYLRKNPSLHKEYEGYPNKPSGWEHEDGSCMMVDAMLEELGLAIDEESLDSPLKQISDGISASAFRVYYPLEYGGDGSLLNNPSQAVMTSRDWIFIKEMIISRPWPHQGSQFGPNDSGFLGRTSRSQEFFYDIVSNRHSGLDVDKIDYLARDYRRAFRGSGEIDFRLIEEAVVAWGKCPHPDKCFNCKGQLPQHHLMICYPEKCAEMCVAFFHHRFKLHATVYSHKTTNASTFMIADILALADPYFRIPPHGLGKPLPISRAMCDPNVYVRLRDSVIDLIEFSHDSRLQPAQDLIRRLRRRDLYKCVASRKIDLESSQDRILRGKTEDEIEQELYDIRGTHENNVILELDDILVEKRTIHMGANESNPLLLMRFLPKRDLNLLAKSVDQLPEAFAVMESQFSAHLPKIYQEHSIRVFCRGSQPKCQLLSHVVQAWITECEQQDSGDLQTFVDEPNGAVHIDDSEALTQEGSDLMLSP